MEKRGKTILILGNGFDLAHGLPTKYSDFLRFCKQIEEILGNNAICNRQENEAENRGQTCYLRESETITIDRVSGIRVSTQKDMKREQIILDDSELLEIQALLDDNVWYMYFIDLYELKYIKGENWIDFESEIRFIIKKVDENTLSLADIWEKVVEIVPDFSIDSRLKLFSEKLDFNKYKTRRRLPIEYLPRIKDFREKTFEDLERLTRVLELYLAVCVENMSVNVRIPVIESLNPDYVINFNYTDTYERIYKKGKIYYIHGKANAKQIMEYNNMVLGIDEYWSEEERNERTNFTTFKKFAQRIQKHTGNESYRYLKEVQNIFKENKDKWMDNVDISRVQPNGISYVYIFGHSLDVTDKDILSNYIRDDATVVTVYCMDKGTEGELIANTIKLITEQRLLEKVNHVPEKLRFLIP